MILSDENECCQMLYIGYYYSNGFCVVCYLCGSGIGVMFELLVLLLIGKGVVKCQGEKIVIFNFGILLLEVVVVVDKFNVILVDMCFVKLLDIVLIFQLVGEYDVLVMLEENVIMGGVGSGVNEVLMVYCWVVLVFNIGLLDYFIFQGIQEEICVDFGFDVVGIEVKICDWLV